MKRHKIVLTMVRMLITTITDLRLELGGKSVSLSLVVSVGLVYSLRFGPPTDIVQEV
jgi:hypothetical protein